MVVNLRQSAWAKSNRPNKFFEQMGMEVAAIEKVGQLIVPVTKDQVRAIQTKVEYVQTRIGLFFLSTMESFAPWTLREVFLDDEPDARIGKINRTIAEGRRFRVEFFPWSDAREELGAEVDIVGPYRPASSSFAYVSATSPAQVMSWAALPEVRHVLVEPQYSAPREIAAQSFALLAEPIPGALGEVAPNGPIVGVIDSGVDAPELVQCIAGRIEYELPPDTDYRHGTFVAGLVSASRPLNLQDSRFPEDRARVLDVVALPNGSVPEGVLLNRVRDAVARHPEVKVWNCSFAAEAPNDPPIFGVFAAELDRISDEAGVLFVIAAGNYESNPIRSWPAAAHHFPRDRIAMPSESVRALTVGAVAPEDCAVPAERPAPYSRRGPGPAFSVKPDVAHYGGGLDTAGQICGGVRSLLPNHLYAESVGTSFSTPLISSISANAWEQLEAAGASPTPSLVKALILHSAALNSPGIGLDERQYVGHGIPTGSVSSLFCDPNSFTLLFEAELQQGVDWEKTPYPIPACLLTQGGALRAEVIITLCYASPCDIAFGDEYVQHDVELSFGTYDIDPSDPTKRKQIGKVPAERPAGLSTREKALLEDGMKYSTAKVFRKRFPQGCSGDQWRLKLSLTRRLEVAENVTQPVYVLVTLRGLEPSLPVYADGVRAVPNNWAVNQLVTAAEARQRVR